MFDKQVIQMIAEGIRDTLYMTLFSTIIGYVIGLPFGFTSQVKRDCIRTGSFTGSEILSAISFEAFRS